MCRTCTGQVNSKLCNKLQTSTNYKLNTNNDNWKTKSKASEKWKKNLKTGPTRSKLDQHGRNRKPDRHENREVKKGTVKNLKIEARGRNQKNWDKLKIDNWKNSKVEVVNDTKGKPGHTIENQKIEKRKLKHLDGREPPQDNTTASWKMENLKEPDNRQRTFTANRAKTRKLKRKTSEWNKGTQTSSTVWRPCRR